MRQSTFCKKENCAAWRRRGVTFVLAHPDDEALFWGAIQQLKDQDIPITAILLTLGELGKANGVENCTPSVTKRIRKAEFLNAMASLGIKHIYLNYPDMKLSYKIRYVIERKLRQTVAELNPIALFTFHPHEITREFDHPDHRITGEYGLNIAAASDVEHFHPKDACMAARPHLFLWTTNTCLAPTHEIHLSAGIRVKRNEYLWKNYPSQFPKESERVWRRFFDAVTSNGTEEKHRELWRQIR